MGTLAHCYREGKMVQTRLGGYNSCTVLYYLLLYNKVNQLHVYICLLPFGPLSHPSIPPIFGSSQSIKQSSLCYTTGSHWLSVYTW